MTNTEVYTEAVIPPVETPEGVTIVATTYRRSPTFGKLALALARAQGAMKNPVKDSVAKIFSPKGNYSYNYAGLSNCRDATAEALSANELALIQIPTIESHGDGGVVLLTTILAHSSGEFIESDLTMGLADSRPQSVGTGITYARRYAMSCVLGIAAEDDDDGASASGLQAETAKRQQQQQTTQKTDGKVTTIGNHRLPEKEPTPAAANVAHSTPAPETKQEPKADPKPAPTAEQKMCSDLNGKIKGYLDMEQSEYLNRILAPFTEGWFGVPYAQVPKDAAKHVPAMAALERLSRDEQTRADVFDSAKDLGGIERKRYEEKKG